MTACISFFKRHLCTGSLVLCFCFYGCSSFYSGREDENFISGIPWLDTKGDTIEAHGGGMLLVNGIYYWYGEHHGKGAGNKTGVCCYSSSDLYHWKNEGIVFPKDSVPPAYRDSGVCERPKVIYNASTGRYVMWMHLDNASYTHSYAGVAISNSPVGPFRFLKAFRPIQYDYGYRLKNGCVPMVSEEDKERLRRIDEAGQGNTFRDMNLFVDDDGSAYVFYASEDNTTLYISRLSDDYTDVQRPPVEGVTWVRALVQQCREAPAPFKYNGKYYMFTSGLTGWAPNPADLAVAGHILGPWQMLGNPCTGPDAEATYYSQSTFVLHAPGKPANCFIYMGDRWDGHDLQKSTFVWLPFCVKPGGTVELVYLSRWNLSAFDCRDRLITPPRVWEKEKKLYWEKIKGAVCYRILRNGQLAGTVVDCPFVLPRELRGRESAYTVQAANLYTTSPPSLPVQIKWEDADTLYLSDVNPDSWTQGFGRPEKDRSVIQLPMTIAGKTFPKGIGTHSPSELVYRIEGQYSRFVSWVGVDGYTDFNTFGSVTFQVWGDGRLLHETPLMKASDAARLIDVSLRGIKTLKLVVTDGGNGSHYDHADWAGAMLIP